MTHCAIEIEHLSKQYRIGMMQPRAATFGGAVRSFVQAPFSHLATMLRAPAPEELIWALHDVSLTVAHGEVLGIIGRNGAGKSTLLKILSRITEPTTGQIKLYGRIGSLLEVGTGFHPELTGRENIYLNGTILGMRRIDIDRRFDAIVDFSGIEKFLDTPVKRYSSGMYVRLAFAVAAHLNPDILLVDEVLAVGDMEFQKKCLGKMHDVGKQGRTVLFVSHNMAAIESLCQRVISLQAGSIHADGAPREVIQEYLDHAQTTMQNTPLAERTDRTGSGKVRVTHFRCLNATYQEVQSLQSGRDYIFEVTYQNFTGTRLQDIIVSLDFFDERNIRVLYLRTSFTKSNLTVHESSGRILCRIQDLALTLGTYQVAIFLAYTEAEFLDYIEDAASVEVDGGDFFGTGSYGVPSHCKVLTRATWDAE